MEVACPEPHGLETVHLGRHKGYRFFSLIFFSFLYYQEQTGTLFICEIRLLFLSLHEERQLGW